MLAGRVRDVDAAAGQNACRRVQLCRWVLAAKICMMPLSSGYQTARSRRTADSLICAVGTFEANQSAWSVPWEPLKQVSAA